MDCLHEAEHLSILVLGDSVDRTGLEHLHAYCQEQGTEDELHLHGETKYEAYYRARHLEIVSADNLQELVRPDCTLMAAELQVYHMIPGVLPTPPARGWDIVLTPAHQRIPQGFMRYELLSNQTTPDMVIFHGMGWDLLTWLKLGQQSLEAG